MGTMMVTLGISLKQRSHVVFTSCNVGIYDRNWYKVEMALRYHCSGIISSIPGLVWDKKMGCKGIYSSNILCLLSCFCLVCSPPPVVEDLGAQIQIVEDGIKILLQLYRRTTTVLVTRDEPLITMESPGGALMQWLG
ncbi:hypothetical protein POM88_037712 [Heracleum sosnowskyi]|uniref:Uncharacterized protein n=1 Tax=Heracleum sosnowskyi TaxID=360622 RepID=A0AAD8HT52_9APIA|nr:hypothetical protein POM88_037712 [Heracleum sosnowskyi]